MNVRLVNNEKDFLKYTSRPTNIGYKKFDKDYAAIHEIKPVLILNKPIYVGFTVLDLSKWKMYDFHYNFIKKNFGAELLFTDTGSLTYKIKSKMFMKNFISGNIYLNLVIIQKIQSFLMRLIKKVIGKMKDEFGGLIITEFVELKSKMYSTKKIDGKEHNTAKGVSTATEFDNFKDVLINKKIIRHKMERIQSKKHKLGTYEIDEISFSCFDNKRYVLDDGIRTLSYFHKKLYQKFVSKVVMIKKIVIILLMIDDYY